MPFVRPSDMLAGDPLPGWSGRFLHSANMTFAHYDIAADAAPLHEHQHEQEEVLAHRRRRGGAHHRRRGAGARRRLRRGGAAHTPHSVRPLSACRAIIADYPLRPDLPGQSQSP